VHKYSTIQRWQILTCLFCAQLYAGVCDGRIETWRCSHRTRRDWNLECLTHFLCRFYPDVGYVSLYVNNERRHTMPGGPSGHFISQRTIAALTSHHGICGIKLLDSARNVGDSTGLCGCASIPTRDHYKLANCRVSASVSWLASVGGHASQVVTHHFRRIPLGTQ